MADATTPLRATVGIISLGDMGSGIARLLVAEGYSVVTNCAGRRYLLHLFLPFPS